MRAIGALAPAEETGVSLSPPLRDIVARMDAVIRSGEPAVDAPPGDRVLQHWFYDARLCWGIRGERSFEENVFLLIDRAASARQQLESLAKEIRGRPAGIPESEKSALPRIEALRAVLLERVYLMEGLARAEVARQMAASGRPSYALEAMQGAVDDLDRALKTSSQARRASLAVPLPQMPVPEIQEIRRGLFSPWEAARHAGSGASLARISIPAIVAAAEAMPGDRTWSALHNFAWLLQVVEERSHRPRGYETPGRGACG